MRKLHVNFTLVELLIVITIIAILAGMLLPALNSARSKAKQIQCIGNFKQLSTAMGAYAVDNNDWMTPRTDGTKWWYRDFLPPYLVKSDLVIGQITTDAKHPFTCPETVGYAATDSRFTAGTVHGTIGYNAWQMDYVDLFKGFRFLRPSINAFIADAYGDRIQKNTLDGNFGEIHLRHFGSANVLYGDLHVAARKKGTFRTDTSASPFWRCGNSYAGMRE